MKKDIEWLKNEILGLSIKARHKENNQREWHMGHEMALFDVNKLINQLDEPEQTDTNVGLSKPVIPQFVADYIELNKGWNEDRQEYIEDDNSGLWFALDDNSYGMPNSVSDWLFNEEKVETFAKAWLDGYKVEKEQKYHVVNKENYFMLRKYDGLVDMLHVSSSMSRDEYGKDTRFMLTEKEIKDYDERYWAFAEEVKP